MASLSELAEEFGGQVDGNGGVELHAVAGLRDARAGEITFLANPRYASLVESTQASAVIVSEDFDAACPCALLRVSSPDAVFAQVALKFAPPARAPAPGIHPTALVDPGATVGEDVCIGAYTVVEEGAVIGARSVIAAQCFIGVGVQVGEDCLLHAQVSIREHCRLGNRVTIQNGSVVGSDGFGYVADENGVRSKIPQIGIVILEDDVDLGANVTVDRARFGQTRLGQGTKVDNLVQVAHNVVTGPHCVLVAQVGISGSTILEEKVILGGQAGVAGHLTVGAGTMAGGQCGITKDVPANSMLFGTPARSYTRFSREHAYVMTVPKLRERVDFLEKRIRELGQQG